MTVMLLFGLAYPTITITTTTQYDAQHMFLKATVGAGDEIDDSSAWSRPHTKQHDNQVAEMRNGPPLLATTISFYSNCAPAACIVSYTRRGDWISFQKSNHNITYVCAAKTCHDCSICRLCLG